MSKQPANTNQTLRNYTHSSSFKMAVLFSLLCGMATVVLGYLIHYFSKDQLIQDVEIRIDTDIQHLKNYQQHDMLDEFLAHHSQQHHLATALYVLLGSNHQPQIINNIELSQNIERLAEGLLIFSSPDSTKKYAAKIYTFPDQQRLLVGLEITAQLASYQRIRWLCFFCIIFMLVVIAVSYLISRFVAGQTNKIAGTAYQIIQTGDLSRRIPMHATWDDLSYMTQVLNELLTRIEELMQGVHQVSDNIAHDLRTPLTRLQSDIDDFSQLDALQSPEIKARCRSIHNEVQHLLETFNALLRISRIETAQSKTQFAPFALHRLIDDVIALYDPLAEAQVITLKTAITAVEFLGDKDLIFQSVANLLDNALKFSPQHSQVCITVSASQNGVQISVTDNGPGIDPSEQHKLFQRFYRGEKSRNTEGNGLGLSLVAAVTALHDGTVNVQCTHPGLQVTMHFGSHCIK